MPETVPQLLPLLAVARALSVSPHTIRAWVRDGKLRPVRLCRRLLFDPADVLTLVAEAKSAPSGQSAKR
jgi:excisionase family DNA binding protein